MGSVKKRVKGYGKFLARMLDEGPKNDSSN